MSSIEFDLNHYLYLEFGFDEEDESRVSESWPFELRKIADLEDGPIFEFDDDEPFFALAAGPLNFLPKAGMDLAALLLQMKGSRWIASRDPVDLEFSRPGDAAVPSGLERRRVLELMGHSLLPGRSVEILEGLWLKTEQRYLGLFQAAGESDAIVGGLPSQVVVAFPEASDWRRLAWGVGLWLTNESAATEPKLE